MEDRRASEITELIVRTIAETAIENEQYFAELDGVVRRRRFRHLAGERLQQGDGAVGHRSNRTSPGSVLKGVSMVIASRVGGVSGALWGTAFLRASAAAGSKQELTRGRCHRDARDRRSKA